MLGWHLVIDGSYSSLSKQEVEDLLKEIVKLAEMDIIAGPITVEGAEYNKGVSSIAVIEYSTISIHTFEDSKHIAIDLYSCKPYDKEKIIRFIESKGINIERESYLYRGLKKEIPNEVNNSSSI